MPVLKSKPKRNVYRSHGGRYYMFNDIAMIEVDLTKEFHSGSICVISPPRSVVVSHGKLIFKHQFENEYHKALALFSQAKKRFKKSKSSK